MQTFTNWKSRRAVRRVQKTAEQPQRDTER